jgi:hypothetical protein
MKKLFYLSLFVIGSSSLYAQQRAVMSSTGGSSAKEGIYLTQTIGQDASFSQQIVNGQYFAQGFQQPIRGNMVSVNEINPTVFPNPNSGEFTVSDLPKIPIQSIQLFDAKGAVLTINYQLNTDQIQCNMENYPAGNYVLNLLFENGQNKSIKIVKILR